MKHITKILTLFLALLMLSTAVMQAVSCGDQTGGPGDTTGPDSTTTGPKPEDSKPTVNPDGTVNYTVKVNSIGGLALEGVTVYVYKADGSLTGKGVKTDANGNAVITLPKAEGYTVELEGYPDGYKVEDRYELNSTTLKIELLSSVITDKDHSNASYKLGDIMRDFEVILTDGTKFKLSEALAEKKAVVLNFWYTTCTYCVEEFPDMNSAYNLYKDNIALVALNNYAADNAAEVKDFKENYYGYALDLPMAKDTAGVENAFNVPGNPVTVVVDRYGMISFYHTGAIPSEKYFQILFEHYTADDYKQNIYRDITELVPAVKPGENDKMPTSEEIGAAINNGDIKVTYSPETETADAEYSWPFKLTEKNGVTCIAPANKDLDSSFATLHAKVELKAGQAFLFDYFSSTQNDNTGADILYVLVDGRDIYTIAGISTEWKTCCPWVADQDGTYDVTFLYYKDIGDFAGDDTVYLKNFRTEKAEDVKVATYIPREAATNPNQYRDDYLNYVTVVYNEADGYYHVGEKDGPILLAKLIGYSNFSSRFSLTEKLIDEGKFIYNGSDHYQSLMDYCSYATNSNLYQYCSVTEELAGYLQEFVKKYSSGTPHENTWLQLCAYYDSYGKDAEGKPAPQLEDPIKGLAPFSAIKAELGSANKVTYNRPIVPRGLLYEFVPATSGVYRVTSNSDQEVLGWIFTGDHTEWAENGGRIMYTHSDTGERLCEELLVPVKDKNGNIVYKTDAQGNYVLDENGQKIAEMERDFTNCSMVAYLEAGKSYYIAIAYYDTYATGSFTFDIKYLGETYSFFHMASPGVFTTEGDDINGDIIAGGIDVILGDDGYYYEKRADGTKGSLIYADFYMPTSIFTDRSLESIINSGVLNFAMSESDHLALGYLASAGLDTSKLSTYSLNEVKTALAKVWAADELEGNWELYMIEDVLSGKYHGKGKDYTEQAKAYIAKMLDEADNPERQGCVAVTGELAEILQLLMDKYTFAGVDHSWTKLCYYYEHLGPQN
ncbi:MAG: redoxin domain-containing protein [Clostridia bacterium]|nr:redoxin domain-containing protein [Clostridia bacterium]